MAVASSSQSPSIAANLMLKRYGDKALEEWRGRLQANYRRRRSARQQRIAGPGALIGTDP
jgi:hypothetical protein